MEQKEWMGATFTYSVVFTVFVSEDMFPEYIWQSLSDK